MSHFTDDALYETRLPKDFLPMLRALDAFDQLIERAKESPAPAREALIEELQALHDTLEEQGRHHMAPDEGVVSDDAARHAFAAGVLRLVHYRATVEHPHLPLVDTCRSHTLNAFEADAGPDDEDALRDRLKARLGFDDDTLAAIDAEIAGELDALKLQHQIVAAVETLHPLDGDADAQNASAYALFTRLYPGHPLRPGDVSIIRTSAGFFFAIPYDDNALTVPDFEDRPAQERQQVADFIDRLGGFQQRYYAHFPSFGFFRGEQADPALLESLVEATGEPLAHIATTLTTMVTVLPLAKIDQYIVHDVWGHYWQALLFDFESTYREVAAYIELPALEGPALDALNAAIDDEPDALARWEDALEVLMIRRLNLALAGLLAEVLSDAVEYKLLTLRPDLSPLMPSSSLFKHLPAKLDLTMHDLPHYFRLALGSLRHLERDAHREALTVAAQGHRPDASPEAVQRAVDAVIERTADWIERVYHPSFQLRAHEDHVELNVFARIALNYLSLHIALNDLHKRMREYTAPEGAPLRGALDLMVFAVASFFEDHRVSNFWHLDEFLTLHFEPLLHRFLDAE